jgi:hypothetical protein
VVMAIIWLGSELQMRSTEYRRYVKYDIMAKRIDRLKVFNRWSMFLIITFMSAPIILRFPSETWTNGHSLRLATATAGTTILWFAMVGFGFHRIAIGGTLFRSRSPDVALVRFLADAFTAVVDGGTSEFRSFTRRSEISAHLRAAAHLLDGPMLGMLTNGDGAAEAIVRPHLQAAATGLLQKLAWLATPKNDTREYLARALGEALISAATGDLARLTSGGAEQVMTAAVSVPWYGRLVGFARWSLIALGPAAALWFGWSLIPNAATQGLAAQFAALCFVIATFSTIDPGGRDKLSTVVSTGATLFGWGKGKT